MSRIFLLTGHPDTESYNFYLASVIVDRLVAAGHEVQRMDAAHMQFDPILHHGYRDIQQLEPDLLAFHQALAWCEHWVLVYPIWWGSTPAVLQGIFDRAILPTIHFTADGPVVTPLMAGRTGHSVATMDAPVSYVADAYGDADIHQVRDALWTFIGMATGATIRLGEVTFASDDERRALAQGAAEHLVATIS